MHHSVTNADLRGAQGNVVNSLSPIKKTRTLHELWIELPFVVFRYLSFVAHLDERQEKIFSFYNEMEEEYV
jgi:hypothetical protein